MSFTERCSRLGLAAAFVGAVSLASLPACKEGVRGGSVQDVFTGVDSVNALSPEAVRITWTTNYRYQEYEVYGNFSSEPLTTRIFDNAELEENIDPNQSYAFSVVAVNGSERSGFEKEIAITMPGHFEGIDTISKNEDGDPVITWNYPYDFVEFLVYWLPWEDPSAANTSSWADVNVTQQGQMRVVQGLPGSTRYHFMVHAKYSDGTYSRPLVALTEFTDSSFPAVTFQQNCLDGCVSVPERVIGSLPFVTIRPTVNALFLEQYYTSQVYVGDDPVTDPLVGRGTVVFSSSSNLGRGRIEDISVHVTYDDTGVGGSINETLVIDGLETYVKAESDELDLPPEQNIGTGEAFFGSSMASGDFNCDGYADLAVGMPEASVGSKYVKNALAGAVLVYYSDGPLETHPSLAENTTKTPALSFEREFGSDPQIITFDDLPWRSYFGYSLASGGNLNGDKEGLNDCQELIVGAPGLDSVIPGGGATAWAYGSAFVFFGSTEGLAAPAHLSDFTANMGTCTPAGCNPVRIYADYSLWPSFPTSGLPNALPAPYKTTQSGITSNGDFFGQSVSFIGDFNADGFDDLAVGAPYADWDGKATAGVPSLLTEIKQNVGYVAVFFGSPEGLGMEYPFAPAGASPDPDVHAGFRFLKIYPPQPHENQYFGWSIAGGADIDGLYRVTLPGDPAAKGGSDMIVGAPGFKYQNPFNQADWNALNAGGLGNTDSTAGLFFDISDGGWVRSGAVNGFAPYAAGPGSENFFLNVNASTSSGTSTGAAYIFYGRSYNSVVPPALPETPGRDAFWACGSRKMGGPGFAGREFHFSCLVRSAAESGGGLPGYNILTPRADTTYFGRAVALAGIPSYYNELNQLWMTSAPVEGTARSKRYKDPNRDGFAEVFVTAHGLDNTGEVWQYFGNRGRRFGTRSWDGITTQFRLNDPNCPGFSTWPAGGWMDPTMTDTVKSNCAPVRLKPNSLGVGSGLGTTPNSVAVADLTADGVYDLIVGAQFDSTNGGSAGAIYAFTSGPTSLDGNTPGYGLTTNFKKLVSSTGDANDRLGYSVAAGNFDRDVNAQAVDLMDVAAGAPFDDSTRPAGGQGHLFLTGGSTLGAVVFDSVVRIDDVLATPQSYGYFTARIVGDVNGDGYDDAFARMKKYDSAGAVLFEAVIYFGSPSGLITSTFCRNHLDQVFTNPSPSQIPECFPMATRSNSDTLPGIMLPQKITKPNSEGNGWATYATAAGDVNGDSFDDVLFWNGYSSLILYFGTANGLQAVTNPTWAPAVNDPQIVSRTLTPSFIDPIADTISVSMRVWPFNHGDFNGDGKSDLVIADPAVSRSADPATPWPCDDPAEDPLTGTYCDNGLGVGSPVTYHGAVFVLYGSAAGIQTPSVRGIGDPGAPAPGSVDFVIPAEGSVVTTAGQLIYSYGLEGEDGADLTETPCTGPADAKDCQNSYIPNPVFELIQYGFQKLQSHAFGSSIAVVNLNDPADPDLGHIDSLIIGAPGYEDIDCWDWTMLNQFTTIPYRNYGRLFVFHGKPMGLRGTDRGLYYPYRNAPRGGGVGAHDSGLVYGQSAAHVEDTDLPPMECGGSDRDRSLRTALSSPIAPDLPLRAISPPIPEVVPGMNVQDRRFGARVSNAGDVNGDGFEDLVIAGPTESVPGLNNVGTGYLIYGPVCGLDNEFIVADKAERFMNYQLRTGSGDGTMDSAVTDINSSAPAEGTCTAAGGQKKPFMQKFYVKDALAGEQYGITMGGGRRDKGDVNGDGFDDVILATPYYDDPITGRSNVGRGVVFFGSNQGLYAEEFPNVTVVLGPNTKYNPYSMVPGYAGNNNAFFEYNLSMGDVNNDGTADILVPSAVHDGELPVVGVDLGVFFLFY
ncbi:MAG: FG-GAP repeat protein [Bdellovibrionales bacterium]|nr:FG-GAP repeat protein [Bdellovibrionales bacterium]